MKRLVVPAGALGLLLGLWGLWNLYRGWNLVSLDFDNAPVAKVLAAISRQGGIEIASNIPPETPVTIKVDRVPAVEALDIVAVRTDASWRLAYLGAKDNTAIDRALAAFRGDQKIDGWTSHGAGGFNFVQPQSGAALDLRLVEWEPAGGGVLHTLLGDAADSTGVYLAAPADWSTQVDEPAGGPLNSAAPALFREAGGVGREVFLVRGSPRGTQDEGDGGGWRGGRTWIGSPVRSEQGGERRPAMDPEVATKRAEAQIALLPKDEQPKAREDMAMMRSFWQSVRELPEEERRAKAREFFNRPEVQERMEDRRLAREAKMTPQQRIDRSQRYWGRKAEAKYRGGTTQ